MDKFHLIFLGLNARVIALSKQDGQVAWSWSSPGIVGDNFVTLQTDDTHVYAFCRGHVHCLDQLTGHLLWSNELKGFGYGVGCLCIPGFGSAPDASIRAKMDADSQADQSAGGAASS